jgi:hypothetical protein
VSERKPIIYERGGLYQSIEDPERCIEKVADFTGFHFLQCMRKRGFGEGGLYCKQHAKRHPAVVEEALK